LFLLDNFMSSEQNQSSGNNNCPEYIDRVNKRVKASAHEKTICEFLMRQFHVSSIDELLKRRGVYTAVAQIDILLDELEKDESS